MRLSLSWSKLKAWENCRQQVLRRMEGKSSTATNGRMFLPGTLADRAMRQWLESPDPQPGEMAEMIEDLFVKYTAKDAEYVIKWRGDPREDKLVVKRFVREVVTALEPILMEKVVPFRYQPELKFRITVGVPGLDGTIRPVDLVGGIDILVQDDAGDFALYDLKATANDAYVRGAILGQLTFYSLAWSAIWGDPLQPKTAGFITPACKEKYVPVVVGPEERRVMMSRVIKYCHGVWRGEWDPKADDTGCVVCDVRHACDKWSPQAVRDQAGKQRLSFADAAETRRRLN